MLCRGLAGIYGAGNEPAGSAKEWDICHVVV